MAHRVYPQNPAVPTQGSVGPTTGHHHPVQPGYSHSPAGMNAATPGDYVSQGQSSVSLSSTVPATGGRQGTGQRYPVPSATQVCVHCINVHIA